MTRVILIAAALVGALIALLVWISSPADDRLKTQNELIDGKVNSLGRRTGERPRVAANWPRKAAHVLIQIAYPKDDPRAARGGEGPRGRGRNPTRGRGRKGQHVRRRA